MTVLDFRRPEELCNPPLRRCFHDLAHGVTIAELLEADGDGPHLDQWHTWYQALANAATWYERFTQQTRERGIA